MWCPHTQVLLIIWIWMPPCCSTCYTVFILVLKLLYSIWRSANSASQHIDCMCSCRWGSCARWVEHWLMKTTKWKSATFDFKCPTLVEFGVVLKPGTERNGTNRTVVFRRRDKGRTYFCPYVALHRRYRNVHVAAKVSTYSTESKYAL